jgi:hypothetical protein
VARTRSRFVGHRFRRTIEEMRRALQPVLIVQPAEVHDGEIEMIFQHPLDRPCLRPLGSRKAFVEIEMMMFFDMGADEGGIAHAVRAHLNEWHLALGRGLRGSALETVGHACHLELNLGFHHERAGIGQIESRAEAEKCNHVLLLLMALFLRTRC